MTPFEQSATDTGYLAIEVSRVVSLIEWLDCLERRTG